MKLKMKYKLGHVLTAPFQVAVHLISEPWTSY